MDNYGNEIGQKMRSAVKAKLVELGTGGSAGYIDDELPDYVMIMVANKRSKQQMISDLNLFLGSQTELFVTWLHEVLQKLQEVTLPSTASSKKRKSSQKEDSTVVSAASAAKKDKKQAKKEKSSSSKKPKESSSSTPDKTSSTKVVSSITDIVAEELLEKAKQNLTATADAAQNIKKSKHKRASEELTQLSNSSEDQQKETEDFDIPTISEISSTTGVQTSLDSAKESSTVLSGSREKDLAELAEIQKKIYAAKKQLKQIGELEDDDDFLNLRDEDSREEFNEAGDLVRKSTPPQQKPKEKSPIIFGREKVRHHDEENEDEDEALASKRKRFTPPPQLTAANNSNKTSKDDNTDVRSEKRSIHERLGMKNPASKEQPKSSQAGVRERRRNLQEQELYVPAFRRKEMERERERERDRERDQDRSRDREREQHTRDRGRERDRDSERRSDRQRESDHNNQPRGRPRVRRSFEDRDKRRSSSENHNEERNSSQVGKISTTTPSTSNRARSSSNDASPDVSATRKRIGSRVIIAPAKLPEMSDEEDLNNKPVNSVIKIKPRPPLSPSKQAPKNLLLRAVAEAQKSTILKKPSTTTKSKVSLRLGEKIDKQHNTKLFTKSYRERLKTTTTSGVGALFTRTTKNLIVEVNGNLTVPKVKFESSSILHAHVDDEYIPDSVSDRGESDQDFIYVPQKVVHQQASEDEDNDNTNDSGTFNRRDSINEEDEDNMESLHKTQFVVTLNDDKTLPKLKRHAGSRYSRSLSPPPQVSSSSSKDRDKYPEPTSTSNSSTATLRKANIKERLSYKSSSNSNERRSNSALRQDDSNTPPPRRTELIEIYRKPKEIKKIIIKNDSEDDDLSPSKKHTPEKDRKLKRKSRESPPSLRRDAKSVEKRSTTPPLKQIDREDRQKESVTPSKRKHVPIKFDFHDSKEPRNLRESPIPSKKRRSLSQELSSRDRARENSRDNSRERNRERATSHERREEKRKISIRHAEAKKYDNIPNSLNSVPVDSSNAFRTNKPKERCKYHPNCTKSFCEFYHPTSTCKSFPNCKFADKCLYSHPKCKYDLACVNLDCNFSHSGPRSTSLLEPTAPPLSSSVVPVQNYKSISSTAVTGPVSSTTCKYFPNCTKTSCPFYHPKPCRYGKNCINKLECLFFHHELPSSSKFKWIAQVN